jgi:glycosyltransferase involved in cell wall biosynthesis
MLKISVITICFNAIETIEATIKSVVNQTYSNIEYIVMDGSSTDGTVDVIKKYTNRISYWKSEPDRGIYDAMNKGIDVATGDFVIFMNSGDLFYADDTVERLVSELVRGTVNYGDAMFYPKRNRLWIGKTTIFKFVVENICHQAMFYPLELLANEKYDLKYRLSADWELNMRLWRRCRFHYIPQIIARYLEDGVSMRETDEQFAKDRRWLIVKHLGVMGLIAMLWQSLRIRIIKRRKVYKNGYWD